MNKFMGLKWTSYHDQRRDSLQPLKGELQIHSAVVRSLFSALLGHRGVFSLWCSCQLAH